MSDRDDTAPAPAHVERLLDLDQVVAGFRVRRRLVERLRRVPATMIRAVDGVSLHVDPGEIVALVGESGCGKTTTAQAALRLLETTSGSIRSRGSDVRALRGRRLRAFRRTAQIVYQDPYESLNPRHRVRHIVGEPIAVHRIAGSRRARDELVAAALERVGLAPASLYLDRFPHELSGGQRQRVAIAAALSVEPALLVADEPVSMLDVSVRAGILNLLSDLREAGLGILLITHDISTAVSYADRVAVMYLGRIVEEGRTDDIVGTPRHPYTEALLSVVPRADPGDRVTRILLTGEIPTAARIPDGCRFHPRCPRAVDRCRTTDPDLVAAEDGHRVACILAPVVESAAFDREAKSAAPPESS